jgi:hypothetical protein
MHHKSVFEQICELVDMAAQVWKLHPSMKPAEQGKASHQTVE